MAGQPQRETRARVGSGAAAGHGQLEGGEFEVTCACVSGDTWVITMSTCTKAGAALARARS